MLMEGEFEIVLANAQRLKAIPRKKTDIIDCKRIANLLRYGWFLIALYRQKRSESCGPQPHSKKACWNDDLREE